MKGLKYNVYQIRWGVIGTDPGRVEGFGGSSRKRVRIDSAERVCSDSGGHKGTRMNGLLCGVYGTPGSIYYTEPSYVLLLECHKLQALVEWGFNPGAPLGPLSPFSKVQTLLTDKEIGTLVSSLWPKMSLEHFCQSGRSSCICWLPCGYSPTWCITNCLEPQCIC